MKTKIILGAAALTTGIVLFSCQKEEVMPSTSTAQQGKKEAVAVDKYINKDGDKLEKRSYKWVNDKLDCSQAGSGCEVKAQRVTSAGIVDLSVIQITKLIEIGSADLKRAVIQNELRDEFPGLYEKETLGRIASGRLNLVLEFPYLMLNNKEGKTEYIYNYESSLNENVLAALRKTVGGTYTKKVQFSTTAIWKCIEDGDNCKVSALRFNAGWLKDNYKMVLPELKEAITDVQFSTEKGNQLLIKTESGKLYGLEL